MPFHYYAAHRLADLFVPLHEHIRAERRSLRPQTPQTIVVGSLDSEAYLQQRFLEVDRILMGVNFPFLETAVENLLMRLTVQVAPTASESWFSTLPPGNNLQRFSGMLEIEITLLAMVQNEQYRGVFQHLGHATEQLAPLRQVALARKLAKTIREHLLHIPREMQEIVHKNISAGMHPLAILWHNLALELKQKNLISPLLDPQMLRELLARPAQTVSETQGALYLFGMPLLSAYHAMTLAAIAKFTDVHLFSVDVADYGGALRSYGGDVINRFRNYRNHLEVEAAASGVEFFQHAVNAKSAAVNIPRIEIWGLPGKWRAAEIIADRWHEMMVKDPALRQDDLALATSDLENLHAAFELAGGKRELTIYTRYKVLQKPQASVELMQILTETASNGLTRALLLDFFENATIRRAFDLTTDTVILFAKTIETIHAYRNDFLGNQSAYNFDAALTRLCRGVLFDPHSERLTGVPGHAAVPEFDSAETSDHFIRCVGFLLKSSKRLSGVRGPELIAAVREILNATPFAGDESITPLLDLITRLSAIRPGENMTAAQMAAILKEYVPGMALNRGPGGEGISLSPIQAMAFTKAHAALFDLNEDTEQRESSSSDDMPEYLAAATKLSAANQMQISTLAALLSGCQSLLLAYSNCEPTTGADKYLAREFEVLRSALLAADIDVTTRTSFSQTVLQRDNGDDPPIASSGDLASARLLVFTRQNKSRSLAESMAPAMAFSESMSVISLSDLERFLSNPPAFKLAANGVLPNDPVDFRRDEPAISVSTGARLKFCEEYLYAELKRAGEEDVTDPHSLVRQQQENALGAPDGFGHANALLLANENNARLKNKAADERKATRLVEYIFHAEIKKPFVVQDAPRLERRYLPSPTVGNCRISGRSGILLQKDNSENLIFLDTAVSSWSKRSELLVKSHLLLSALLVSGQKEFVPAAIEIGKYAVSAKNEKLQILESEFSLTARIEAAAIEAPHTYLTELVASISLPGLFWFDLGAISGKKLSSFSSVQDSELLALLENKESTGFDAARNDFIRRFYDLGASAESITFFRAFIQCVARLDALNETPRAKGGKRAR